jgi:hypothetical protein
MEEPAIEELAGIDTSVPHSARIYDYILGGSGREFHNSHAIIAWNVYRPHIR